MLQGENIFKIRLKFLSKRSYKSFQILINRILLKLAGLCEFPSTKCLQRINYLAEDRDSRDIFIKPCCTQQATPMSPQKTTENMKLCGLEPLPQG